MAFTMEAVTERDNMASVRVLTNEAIGVAASTNNYATFKMPAGNISSISFMLRGTTGGSNTVQSQFDGWAAAFKRVKITFDGQVVFDHTQFDATLAVNGGYQVIDQVRTVLNGSSEKGVQFTRPYLVADTAHFGEIDFPLMLTTGKEVNAQIVFDVNVESAYCDGDAATGLVGDVMVNYVDSLSGTYTTRSLSRESSLATTGTAIKQIPEVAGYALEALLLNSVNSSGVGKNQFGADSRISLRDMNGNVFMGERSGIEYGMLAQQKWGSVPYAAESGGTDIPARRIELTPQGSLVGVIMLDCLQMVGSAALYLSPDTASLDLDITAVYVQRNTAVATAKQAQQLATTSDSIGEGETTNPAIQ